LRDHHRIMDITPPLLCVIRVMDFFDATQIAPVACLRHDAFFSTANDPNPPIGPPHKIDHLKANYLYP
jgi:hypothetical protein